MRSGGIFDYDAKRERLEEVERELENPDIWNDPERAQALGRERSMLDKTVNGIRDLKDGLGGAGELLELAEMEDDEETALAVVADVDRFEKGVDQLEFQRMFSGKMDSANAFVDIQAGAGGTEAQDWAEILLRMYLRWAENRGWKTELMEVSGGDVAGIKSATFRVEGEYAYGWLKTEIGVHRLVRKSPFDSDNRRHTSFTSVFVSPEVDDDIEIDINPADLRTDVYRSSGAGGQHVNKTESAVRITHEPTGLVVAMQDEKSQTQNRERAMVVLRSRLLALRRAEQDAETAGAKRAQGGGGGRSEKIRTYNYKDNRVTDHRIGLTLYSLDKVLAGELDLVSDPLLSEERARLLTSET